MLFKNKSDVVNAMVHLRAKRVVCRIGHTAFCRQNLKKFQKGIDKRCLFAYNIVRINDNPFIKTQKIKNFLSFRNVGKGQKIIL